MLKGGTPVSEANARKFLEALETNETLRKRVNLEESMVTIAKEWDPKLDFTAEELDKVIEKKWGKFCTVGLAMFCFSEVPGF
jgi:hypothetical protein